MARRGSPGSDHSGHGGRRIEVEPALPDEQAHRGVQHRLGHGPAEQRRLRRDRGRRLVEVLERAGVALGDEPPALHHHHGEGGGQRSVGVEDLVEQWRQRDAVGHAALGPGLGRPGHARRLAGQRDERAHSDGEEGQQRRVRRGRLLLLHPVAGPVDHGAAAEVGQRLGHGLGRARHHEVDRVERAGDEADGHGVDRRRNVLGPFPVGVHVAVEADRAEQAAALEPFDVDVDVRLGQPGRQRGRGRRQDVEERRPLARRVDQCGVGVGHPLAARRVEHGAHPAARVGLELGLGRPDLLEVQHVEELALEEVLEDLRGRARRLRVGHAHVVDGGHAVGMQPAQLPHHHGAPVVPGEHRCLVAVVVEQPAQVAGQLVRAVVGHRGGMRSCGRSRAGPARRRGSRPRPGRAAGGATSTRARGNRGTGRRGGRRPGRPPRRGARSRWP